MKDPLFEPITINKLEVSNRFYMPAMHLGMGNEFQVTDQIVDFYAERARGGAGMICVGFVTVDELSGNMQNIGGHKDEFIPGLTRLASAIKDNGSLAAALDAYRNCDTQAAHTIAAAANAHGQGYGYWSHQGGYGWFFNPGKNGNN